MIKEDYVSFETAKLLKEKGFDADTEHNMWYVVEKFSTGCHWNSCTYKVGDITREYDEKCCIVMPTLQMVMKWLREVHSCYIVTYWEFKNYDENGNPVFKDIIWSYNIAIPKYNSARRGDGDYFDIESEKEDYTTYEEVCEAAIKYCLENLI